MGKFIVLEGMDGSGKSTQTKMLKEYLESKGLSVKTFHFPTGEKFYGEMINSFLRGEFGDAEEVDPYFAAFIFAGDRKEKSEDVNKWLSEFDVVLLDRYIFSNMAYQCGKIYKTSEQRKMREWIYQTEFTTFEIPKPDISIFLGAPMSFVKSRLDAERTGKDREYLNGCTDIHEKDILLQYRVNEQYHFMCEEYEEIVMVDCTDETGKMLSGEDIHQKVLKVLTENEII